MQRQIPRGYTFKALLGQGGFGAVCSVIRDSDREEVALKIVDLEGLSEDTIANEVKLFPLLQHKNIVRCYNTILDRELRRVYVEMELCSKGSMRDYINDCKAHGTPIEETRIWMILAEILQGVSYLHSRYKPNEPKLKCIIHRDLKPENVLLNDKDEVKICDFGVSRPLGKESLAATYAGTRIYMAPEIVRNLPYTEKVDVWSIGCIALELATLRRVPFGAPGDTEVIYAKNPPIHIPGNYSEDLKIFIEACLQVDQQDRCTVYELLTMPRIADAVHQSRVVAAGREEAQRAKNCNSAGGSPDKNGRRDVHNFTSAVESPLENSPVMSPKAPAYNRQKRMLPSDPNSPQPKLQSSGYSRPPNVATREVRKTLGIDKQGNTPLMLAVKRGADPSRLGQLLSGAGYVNNEKDTALIMAAERGLDAHVRVLAPYEAGIRQPQLRISIPRAGGKGPKIQVFKDVSALMIAALLGQNTACRELLEYEAGLKDGDGNTALMFSCYTNISECTRLLLCEAGQQNARGETALMIATQLRRLDLVQLLAPYEHSYVTQKNVTALMLACETEDVALIDALQGYELKYVTCDLRIKLARHCRSAEARSHIKTLMRQI
ncbi:Kinase, NEK [Giardia muris]|uniref:Kinase, NEK n=1 Tax=Giardia muris TaxID=5742 RepID=A0A4Z1SRG6_GIAMU|nr:Kinase, NEK [Giardia muris]|eukprot:TNJ28482.1 Kinase, NEK [Giardia muris]